MDKQRNILVTAALPYANGPIHLGHMVGYIQADIWTRFQQMNGHHCHYICGDDSHGTPIMIKAENLGITPEELIHKTHQEHLSDFNRFDIKFDNFYITHSPENQELSEYIYRQLIEHDDIEVRTIKQAFDPVKQMFLPDRYVKGTCPGCKAADQYGDSCEQCGATYSPTDLIDPVSVLSGTKPIEKESEHFFFRLGKYKDFLESWTRSGHLQNQVKNKLEEWFKMGLRDWDISRDAPYFGFQIPGNPGKFFYVWLDAPVGYMASFKNFCNKQGNIDFDEYWGADSTAELYHFIGKDIIYFHSLFWPAMLKGAGFRTPTAIYANGFLTINGEKMSKSRGTFITAQQFLQYFEPECLRYYFAAKLNSHIEDFDLNFEDFAQKINSDLVGKVVNIASRCAKFINGNFDNMLAAKLPEPQLFEQFTHMGAHIATLFEAREYNQAIREIMSLADQANQYIDANKPWKLIKEPEKHQQVQEICSQGLNLFRVIMTYLKPVLPKLAEKVEELLNIAPMTWENRYQPILQHTINPFTPLMQRVSNDQLEGIKSSMNKTVAETKQTENKAEQKKTEPSKVSEKPATIGIDDFNKVELVVAEIISAEHVEGADKLLKLQLNVGDSTKQVFAGIKSAYQPEDLVGKLTVMVNNLEPRKMRFGLSEGMVIVAGDGKGLWMISPESGAKPGMRVK